METIFYSYITAKEGKKLQSKIKKIAKKVEQDDFDDELEMVFWF